MKTYFLIVTLLFASAAAAQTAAPPTRLEQIQVFTEDLAKREASIRAKSDQIAALRNNFNIGNPPVQRIEGFQAQEIRDLEAVSDQFFGRHVPAALAPDTELSLISKATGPVHGDDAIADQETKIRYRLSWHRQREIGLGLQHIHEELDIESAKAKAAIAAAPVAK